MSKKKKKTGFRAKQAGGKYVVSTPAPPFGVISLYYFTDNTRWSREIARCDLVRIDLTTDSGVSI